MAELLAASGAGSAATSGGSHRPGEGVHPAVPLEPEDGIGHFKAAAGNSEAVVLDSVVDQRASKPEDVEAAGPTQPAQNAGEGAWPTTDQHDPAAHGTEARTGLPASTPRRESPLVAGLVKAMREAAEASRGETIATLQAEATAQVEAIRSGATEEAEALRQQADEDIAGIRDWAKSETARIKGESEQRIVDRRDALERELEDHAGDVDAQAAQVEAAVAAYETEMESFFERLLAESDPARLATLAERAPEPPILSQLPVVQRVATKGRNQDVAAAEMTGVAADPTTDTATDPDADLVTEAEADTPQAEMTAGVFDGPATGADGNDMSESDEPEATAAEAMTDTSDADLGTGTAESYDETQDGESVDALAPEAAAAAEAEAFEGLGTADVADDGAALADAVHVDDEEAPQPRSSEPGRQRVVVVGLATVAGISAFKSALGQIGGVHNVSVMAGDPGSFVFTVLHDPALDLRPALPELPSFDAQITADDGDTIHVAAREPAA